MLENASNLLFIYFAGDFICILIEIVFNRSGVPDYNTHTYIHTYKGPLRSSDDTSEVFHDDTA